MENNFIELAGQSAIYMTCLLVYFCTCTRASVAIHGFSAFLANLVCPFHCK